ncbi:MAG TPA: hypothetical protein PKN59_01255, partial [Syntrophales bacterium]|nr:hypothetical protein [Syntrophales bacterium]
MSELRYAKSARRGVLTLLGLILPALAFPGIAAAQKAGTPDLSTAVIRVAKENIPAVVHIEVTRSQ